MAKAALNQQKALLLAIKLNFEEEAISGAHLCMVLKLEYFGKWIRNTFKILKSCA
jgi:hypothetical protein